MLSAGPEDAFEVTGEFEGAALGDARLQRRLLRIVEALAAAPRDSFPEQFKTQAEREAFYRFVGNVRASPLEILEPHIGATAARAREYRLVRVLHDTTECVFSGDRRGLGIVGNDTKGFFLHASLVVGDEEQPTPLGVIAVDPWSRARRPKTTKTERERELRAMTRAEKESSRWERGAIDAQSKLPPDVVAIHVADQEADDYSTMAALEEEELRFVVRGSSERLLERHGHTKVQTVLNEQPGVPFRRIVVSERKRAHSIRSRKAHPQREQREANLLVRWAPLTCRKPQYANTKLKQLNLSVVQVFEPSPPEGEQPIQWTLFTNESVTDLQSATAVVDHYRARWTIEEYFKALKSGCAFEERQLESFDTLLVAMALFIPIAWQLLTLRTLGRREDSPAAEKVFDTERLALLAVLAAEVKRPLPKNPTVRDAMLSVAGLGGHIKQNGDPGWAVLGRGYQKLLLAEAGWRAARGRTM